MARKNGKTNPDTVGMFGVSLITISWLVALFVDNLFILEVAIGAIIIGVLCVIYRCIASKKEMDEGKEKYHKNLYDFQNEYYNYSNKLGVVKSGVQVTLLDGAEKIPQHIWIADNKINLFPVREYYECRISAIRRPDITELQFRTISVEDIMYFEELGELRKYAVTSGGGIDFKGALIGKILAGDAGMVLGGRQPIKTEIVSEDDRKVELIYKNFQGEIENLEFTHEAYALFRKLIPDKELRRIKNLQ